MSPRSSLIPLMAPNFKTRSYIFKILICKIINCKMDNIYLIMLDIRFQFWSSSSLTPSSKSYSCSLNRIPLMPMFHKVLPRNVSRFFLEWLHSHEDINHSDKPPYQTVIVLSRYKLKLTKIKF